MSNTDQSLDPAALSVIRLLGFPKGSMVYLASRQVHWEGAKGTQSLFKSILKATEAAGFRNEGITVKNSRTTIVMSKDGIRVTFLDKSKNHLGSVLYDILAQLP